MRYYRCRCGEMTAWSSMGVPACHVCAECNSTLAKIDDMSARIAKLAGVTVSESTTSVDSARSAGGTTRVRQTAVACRCEELEATLAVVSQELADSRRDIAISRENLRKTLKENVWLHSERVTLCSTLERYEKARRNAKDAADGQPPPEGR